MSSPYSGYYLGLIKCHSGDVEIVSRPREMMVVASGLAIAGLPKVIEMLKDGDAEPIWNLSDAIDSLLHKREGGIAWNMR